MYIQAYHTLQWLRRSQLFSSLLAYNSVTQTIINYGIGVTDDALLISGCGSLMGTPECVNGQAEDYLPGGAFSSLFPCGYSGPTTLYACSSPNVYPDINIDFSSPLGSGQGTVAFTAFYSQQGTVASANGDSGTGYATVVSPLPEPRFTFILLVISAGIAAAKLRLRAKTSSANRTQP